MSSQLLAKIVRRGSAARCLEGNGHFKELLRRRRYFFNSSNSPRWLLKFISSWKESGSTRWRQYFGGPSIRNLNLFNAFHRSIPNREWSLQRASILFAVHHSSQLTSSRDRRSINWSGIVCRISAIFLEISFSSSRKRKKAEML